MTPMNVINNQLEERSFILFAWQTYFAPLGAYSPTQAAWYNTWLLIKLTPKGVVLLFLFFFHTVPRSSLYCQSAHKSNV